MKHLHVAAFVAFLALFAPKPAHATDALIERLNAFYEGEGSSIATDDVYFCMVGFIREHMDESECVDAIEAAGPLTMSQDEKDELHELILLIPEPLDLGALGGLLAALIPILAEVENAPRDEFALTFRYALFGAERSNPLLDTPAEVRAFLGLPTP